jgi:eukaryotic-like serine/threonine-protein kinase
VVAPEARTHPKLETLHDYLEYKARGVPRLLLMELNSFVRWEGGRPEIVVSGPELARVEFYADLERTLRAFLRGDGEQPLFSVPIDEDRWRLGAYYLTDWILRTRGGSFTVKEIVDSFKITAIDPELALSEGKVERLLEHLEAHEKLRSRGGADETYYGDVPEAQEPVYRVNEDLDVKLSAFARVNEHERADLAPEGLDGDGEPRPRQPWLDTDAGRVVMDRYELLEEIDRGGSGRVYRTYDRLERREVAMKLLDIPQLTANEVLKARFLRKGRLAKELQHANLVQTHDVFADDDSGALGIVMDFVEGVPLEQLLSQTKLPAPEAVALVARLADVLDYVHHAGLARLDLKPSRIVLDRDRQPVILDLGLIKQVHEEAGEGAVVTRAGVKLGTPLYAAPEQLMGQPVDIRADICSLGLILFEMIAGRRARGEVDVGAALIRATQDDVDVSGLDVSPKLREVIRRCVARDPNERFDTPAALQAALADTREARIADGQAAPQDTAPPTVGGPTAMTPAPPPTPT